MAPIVDKVNTLTDIQRLVQRLIKWLVVVSASFFLGRLLCYYQRTQAPSTVVCEHTVLCNCPALPTELPVCGIK